MKVSNEWQTVLLSRTLTFKSFYVPLSPLPFVRLIIALEETIDVISIYPQSQTHEREM